MESPYNGKPQEEWQDITVNLVCNHPLLPELADVVLESWNAIFKSKIGDFYIGKDIFPEPQIMGFFLHDLIALYLSERHQGEYRLGSPHVEKDVHCINDPDLSFEIKTSSNPTQIFGNRSYAQPASGNEAKSKDGFMLAVNFEKFTPENTRPQIKLIRFGYLEHSDWIAQSAATGQQARLSPETYRNKFVKLYPQETEMLFDQE